MSAGVAFLVLNDAITKTLTVSLPMSQVIMIRAFAIFCVCLILLRGRMPRLRQVAHRDVALRTFFTIANVFAFVAAVSSLPFSVAVLVDFTSILVVAVGAPLIVKEHLSWPRLAAAMFGILGAALVLSPELLSMSALVLLPLLSALTGGARELWTRKLRFHGPNAIELTLLASIGLMIIAPLSGGGWIYPSMAQVFWALLAGFLQALSLILIAHAMFVGQASVVAPFRLTALVWAILISFYWFDERPSGLQLAGIATIVVALTLVSLPNLEKLFGRQRG